MRAQELWNKMAGLQCFGCGREFGFFRREHACKKCGGLFCSDCTSHSMVLPEHGSKKVKVCFQCYKNATSNAEKKSQITDGSNLNDLNRNTALLGPGCSPYQKNSVESGPVRTNIPVSSSASNENLSVDPDEAIRRRLAELRTDNTSSAADKPPAKLTDEELGNRFEDLTGRKATSMQNSNINTFLPKKSEVEEVDDLMKQMMAENKLDEDHETDTTRVTDKEIEERLAKLKGLDPSVTNQPKASEFDSDEDDEKASERYLKQILGEVALEIKTDNIDVGEINTGNSSKTKSSKSQKPGKSKPTDFNPTDASTKLSSIFSKDYEASSDDDELPWCCICNGNAVLRCHGCDDDLYCRRCYREGHSREDYEDHDISEYRPPRKKR